MCTQTMNTNDAALFEKYISHIHFTVYINSHIYVINNL